MLARFVQEGELLRQLNHPNIVQMIASQEIDGRTDIWSFGVLLFEMLAGERPFASSQIAATIAAILNNPPPNLLALRPDTPPALATLIERMLVKERGDRIGRMRLVAAELEQIRDNLLS